MNTIKKNELQDYLLHSHEKVRHFSQKLSNENINKVEFEFISLSLSHWRYWKHVFAAAVATKWIFSITGCGFNEV